MASVPWIGDIMNRNFKKKVLIVKFSQNANLNNSTNTAWIASVNVTIGKFLIAEDHKSLIWGFIPYNRYLIGQNCQRFFVYKVFLQTQMNFLPKLIPNFSQSTFNLSVDSFVQVAHHKKKLLGLIAGKWKTEKCK